jgi:hypothetical protein
MFKRNYFLVIYVKPDNFKFPIIIPVPIFALEDVLDSLISIVRWVIRLSPDHKKFGPKIKWKGNHTILVGDEYLDLALEWMKELRRVGPFTLVEVDDEGTHVSIKLY